MNPVLPSISTKRPLWLLAVATVTGLLNAAPLPIAALKRDKPVDFPSEVYPVLKANCIACHNKTTTKGGLNMETPELMKIGGDSGAAIVPGKGSESLLLQSAAHETDSEMPPKGNKVDAVNLTSEELGLLKLWIDQGAKPGQAVAQEIAWKPLPPGLLPIYAVAISPDGSLAACSRANQVFIYDLATRRQIAQLDAHRDMTMSLAFSPDGTRLASGSYGEVKVWNRSPSSLQPGADARRLMDSLSQVQKLERDSGIAALDKAHHAAAVAAGTAEITALKDRIKKATDSAAATKKKADETRAALKPATDATGAAQKALDETNALAAKAQGAKQDASLVKKQADAKTRLDAAMKAEAAAKDALKAAETAASDAANEVPRVTKLLADAEKAATEAKKAQEAQLAAQKKLADELAAAGKTLAETIKSLPALPLSPDQRFLIEPQTDGSSVIWTAPGSCPVAKCVPKAGTRAAPAWKPDGQLALPADSTLQDLAPKWSMERQLGSGAAKSEIEDRANAITFSPDGHLLAVGSGEPSRGGDITLWDVATGKLVRSLHDRHSDTVLSLDFSPDGKLIASGGADKQLRISSVADGRQLKVFEGHTHHVMGVSWRADGRVLTTSGADNVAKVWDWLKGERRKNLDGWDKEVTSVRYLGPTTRLFTTSGDKQVRLIGEDAAAPAALKGTTDFMQSGAVSRDGRWAAAGGEDSVLRIWDIKTGASAGEFARP